MQYSKNDIVNVATKLGRLANGGVVGYYAGGKTSEIMSNTIPDELVSVVERHKKVQLGASLAQSFIPGAGIVATSAAVASLWKMYYDINQVLGIKISDNVGKSLTSAVMTNLTSAGAQIGATAISEGAKFIPFVGWVASAAISTVTSTAIVYGAAYLYLTALTKMYEAEGKFDLDYLTSSLEDEDYSSEWDEDDEDYEEEGPVPLNSSTVRRIKQTIANLLDCDVEDIISTKDLEDDLNADDDDKQYIIDDLEAEFDIIISKTASDITFVDDLIECVTGESIWQEDEEYEDEELENDRDEEDDKSRFNSFFDSYIKGDYNTWKFSKLAGLFENEAKECQYDGIKSQYYCVAAVVRLEYFLEEWLNNHLKNYSTDDKQKELFQECLVKGHDDIMESKCLLQDDKEYLIISATLAMLKDFWLDDSKEQKDYFVELYGGVVEECKDFDNCMFNMEWLVEMFTKSYDAIMSVLDSFNNRISDESSYNEAEKEYLDNICEFLEDDAEITPRERKMLDRIRQKLGISEGRAQELEASLTKPQLTEDEQEYLDMYHEYAEKGEVTEKERRRLDKFAAAMGITAERVKEIEKV